MIITTTNNVPGMEIAEYKGFATGEVVAGINFIKDLGAGIRNLFGGRVQGYEDEIIQARTEALKELEARAAAMGANAVIGVRIDFDALGSNGNNMLLVTVTGTAVVVR
ncbi:heavy metal-binding domain-containing protein [uncultured Gemella sp.]|uniref:heavy metal-binding domain-containing protein n=1 Tax=uncultured Gemella sp. TaxID=254352 RepID=UPI0028D1A3A1|nr:heavy metal-binding domain-containing protein [uncultured Gemella sp.]